MALAEILTDMGFPGDAARLELVVRFLHDEDIDDIDDLDGALHQSRPLLCACYACDRCSDV